MNFEQAAALYKLNQLPSEKMVDVAMLALEAGTDIESIILLAVESDLTQGTLKPLFEKCLKDLKLDRLTEQDVIKFAAEYYANLAKSGEISEIEFGFKIGAMGQYAELPDNLKDAFQNAMWFEEAPYEYGYPKDYASCQRECSKRIWEVVNEYAA